MLVLLGHARPRAERIQSPVPLHRAGRKHPRPARGGVVSHVGIPELGRRATLVQARVVRRGHDHVDVRRRGGEDSIDLVAEHARQHGAGLKVRAGAHPARAVGDHHVRVERVVVVHHADQRRLGTVDRCPDGLAPQIGRERRIGTHDRVGGVLVAHDGAIGLTGGDARLQADLPIDHVGAEEAEIHPGVARRLHRVVHLLGVVLVVTDGQECRMVEQRRGRGVRIDVGGISGVEPLAFEESHHVDLPAQELACTLAVEVALGVLVGAVEGDLGGRLQSDAVGVVEVVAAPVVVGGIGGDAGLHQDGRGARVVAHDEDDVALLAAGAPGQLGEVDAARPVGGIGAVGNGKDVRIGPVALDQARSGVGHRARRLRRAAPRNRTGDQATPRAAVPADPVDVDRIGRIRGLSLDV